MDELHVERKELLKKMKHLNRSLKVENKLAKIIDKTGSRKLMRNMDELRDQNVSNFIELSRRLREVDRIIHEESIKRFEEKKRARMIMS